LTEFYVSFAKKRFAAEVLFKVETSASQNVWQNNTKKTNNNILKINCKK